jgi:SNF2 family DNA or RNA helicase
MSFALQANWHDGSLYLWARPEPGQPTPDNATLRAAVGEVSSDALLASTATEGRLTLALPAASDGNGHGAPQPYEAPALVLGPAEAVDFLTSLPCQMPESCSPSLGYWSRLAGFVLRLIAAQQFVPRVDDCGEGALCGSWRVLVGDRDQLQWLEQFAAAMPPVCRATAGPGGPDERPEPAHLVETFLGATTDALIRRAVADDPFFQRVHDKAAAGNAPAEIRWLSSLLGPDRTLRVNEEDDYNDTETFVQHARAWLGQLDDSQAAAMRLSFVLHEPPEEDDEEQGGDGVSEYGSDGVEGEEADLATGAAAESETHADTPTPPQPDAQPAIGNPPSVMPATPWLLTLHLQSMDGEGETIDAASLWEGQAKAAILGRSVARRQAALIAELARAAEVFPPAQSLLNHAEPSRLNLSTTNAHAFIRHWAPLLRERDFGVTLPDWASYPDEEVGLRMILSPTDDLDELFDPFGRTTGSGGNPRRGAGDIGEAIEFSTGHFGLDSLMNFDWQIAIGNLRLTTADFEHLVAQNQPLVKHNGRWIHLDLDATRKALEFVKKKRDGRITLADAFRTAFTANKAETGLNVIGLTGTSWIEQLLEQAPGKSIEAIAQPESFVGDLRPYQLRGLHWLTFLDRLGLGACLADDMGLGKTIQLIALLLHERERRVQGSGVRVQEHAASAAEHSPSPGTPGEGRGGGSSPSSILHSPSSSSPPLGPTLLFAPTSVVGNWLRELERFAKPLKVLIHHGPDRLSGDAFAAEAKTCDVVVTSYSLAHRDKEELARVPWHRIALDEAQKIKNPAAAATVAIRSLYAPHRVALTGTPIENHLSELWSIMQVLNPGLLGTAADFREKFAVPIEKLGEKDRAHQLRQMIRPFILRRTKADPTIAGDLPEKLEMKVFCNLTAEQAALYERFVNDSLRQIDSASGIRRRGLILATLTRLKQICDHPGLLDKDPGGTALDHRSGKCERLLDMAEELLEEGDAALVFTQYREMGHLLERAIKSRLGKDTFFLHGGTPAKTRDQMIQDFQAQGPGAPKIFLLSLRAGGLGLNLTAANHVFHYDRWWNPAVEAQATDRAHRVGQTRTVQVHKFVCIGTMEERIDRLLSEKQALADQIVGSGDEWLTNLSTDQLREYLTLSKEAVGAFD